MARIAHDVIKIDLPHRITLALKQLHKLATVIQKKAGDATQLVVLARRGQYALQIGLVDIPGIRDAVVNQFVHWVFAVKSNGASMLQRHA